MKRSTEQIVTTHTGSLPRPQELAEALERRDHGDRSDPDLDARIRDAVIDVARRQAQVGVDVVNDGEAGKIGYSTYVKERLDGFGGFGAFPTFAAAIKVHPTITWAKLRALSEGARLASQRLWSRAAV